MDKFVEEQKHKVTKFLLEHVQIILAHHKIPGFELDCVGLNDYVLKTEKPLSPEVKSQIFLRLPNELRLVFQLFEAKKESPELPKEEKSASDPVRNPSHYASGKFEVIEFITDQGWVEGFCRGNAVKYVARAGKKEPGKDIEDLRKAVWYLDWLVEVKKAAVEGREPCKPKELYSGTRPAPTTFNYGDIEARLMAQLLADGEKFATQVPYFVAGENIKAGDMVSFDPNGGKLMRYGFESVKRSEESEQPELPLDRKREECGCIPTTAAMCDQQRVYPHSVQSINLCGCECHVKRFKSPGA